MATKRISKPKQIQSIDELITLCNNGVLCGSYNKHVLITLKAFITIYILDNIALVNCVKQIEGKKEKILTGVHLRWLKGNEEILRT